MLAATENERTLLQQEKQEIDNTVQDLSKKENQLRADLRKKRKAVADLENAIEKIIAEEIRLAAERARAEAATSKTGSGFALTPEEGADNSIYVASSPDVEGVTGQYFIERDPAESSPLSYDESVAQRLWEVSERLTTFQL